MIAAGFLGVKTEVDLGANGYAREADASGAEAPLIVALCGG
jgi:hypothetical protein